MNSVAFVGDWDFEGDALVRSWLSSMVSFLYDRGARRFYVGSGCWFDNVASGVMFRFCEERPDVLVHWVYCPGRPLPSERSHEACNRWMIDRADAVVACTPWFFNDLMMQLCEAEKQGKPIFYYFPPRGGSLRALTRAILSSGVQKNGRPQWGTSVFCCKGIGLRSARGRPSRRRRPCAGPSSGCGCSRRPGRAPPCACCTWARTRGTSSR